MNNNGPARGDVVLISIDSIAFGGEGVGRSEGLVFFVPYTAPGDMVRVVLTERKKSYARARVEEIISASPLRRAAPCKYYQRCGGCQLQHLEYAAQLEIKSGFVNEALRKVAHLDQPGMMEIRSSGEFGYRMRAQLKLQRESNHETGDRIKAGFHGPSSHRVCDIEECMLCVPEVNEAITRLREKINEPEPAAAIGINFVREVEIAAGESGVKFEPALEVFPSGALERTVSGIKYLFGPSSFFQSNVLLVDELVKEAIGSYSGGLALDLYSGVGLFALQLGQRFHKVISVESDGSSIDFQRVNAQVNGLENIKISKLSVSAWLKQNSSDLIKPDLVLLDPPRAGAAETMPYIVSMAPGKIAYVSCDPQTFARDARSLIDGGYKLLRITAFDMFPQTYHVEIVAHFER